MKYSYQYRSPLGVITVYSDGTAVTGLVFGGAPEAARADLAVLAQTEKWLDIFFSGKAPDFTPPVSLDVSPFAKAVLGFVSAIPYGETATYGEIARKTAVLLGRPLVSARAVGGAVAHNPVSLIVPCHRVIGAGGKLVGYEWGVDVKKRLLDIERACRDR